MNRMQRAALLTKLVRRLRDEGSWGGETHVQKATYFLQDLMRVPLDFDFILYKHGPYSFDLHDEIAALRGDGLLTFELHDRYSPHLQPTDIGAYIQDHFPKTLARYDGRIRLVAETFGDKGVVQLELLGTALYVTLKYGRSEQCRAAKMTCLKPHISLPQAREAVAEVDRIIADSEAHLTSRPAQAGKRSSTARASSPSAVSGARG